MEYLSKICSANIQHLAILILIVGIVLDLLFVNLNIGYLTNVVKKLYRDR